MQIKKRLFLGLLLFSFAIIAMHNEEERSALLFSPEQDFTGKSMWKQSSDSESSYVDEKKQESAHEEEEEEKKIAEQLLPARASDECPFTFQEKADEYEAWCSLCYNKRHHLDRRNKSGTRSNFFYNLQRHLKEKHQNVSLEKFRARFNKSISHSKRKRQSTSSTEESQHDAIKELVALKPKKQKTTEHGKDKVESDSPEEKHSSLTSPGKKRSRSVSPQKDEHPDSVYVGPAPVKKIKIAAISQLVNSSPMGYAQRPIIVKDEETITLCIDQIKKHNLVMAGFLLKKFGITLTDLESTADFNLKKLFQEDNAPLIKFLIQQGFHPNHKVKLNTTTPLHTACRFNRVEIIKILILGGADMNALDEDEKTPLERLNQRNTHSSKDLLKWLASRVTFELKKE